MKKVNVEFITIKQKNEYKNSYWKFYKLSPITSSK